MISFNPTVGTYTQELTSPIQTRIGSIMHICDPENTGLVFGDTRTKIFASGLLMQTTGPGSKNFESGPHLAHLYLEHQIFLFEFFVESAAYPIRLSSIRFMKYLALCLIFQTYYYYYNRLEFDTKFVTKLSH